MWQARPGQRTPVLARGWSGFQKIKSSVLREEARETHIAAQVKNGTFKK